MIGKGEYTIVDGADELQPAFDRGEYVLAVGQTFTLNQTLFIRPWHNGLLAGCTFRRGPDLAQDAAMFSIEAPVIEIPLRMPGCTYLPPGEEAS